ncbi:hypothetical protein KB879_32995 (plasmid) [Cupriavidus sp. KK10]|jgi:hypothetical protein|uniref:hypothetical protein n=1 Tax=Cupriavidus sp. KK10 TaxID=1478019 RepID=UPI001BAE4A6B|nr:hypothetical protein KB879_32995 [Cupriavidus sp. KK10]
MVNGRQTKNLPGCKTDMLDCQWGATLHAHGLLRAGFVPPAHIRDLQDYMRLRADHIALAASHVQPAAWPWCEPSSTVSAIPIDCCRYATSRFSAPKPSGSRESLRGTWDAKHLFALRQALQSWEHYQHQITECDRQILALLPRPTTNSRQAIPPTPSHANVRVPTPQISGNCVTSSRSYATGRT